MSFTINDLANELGIDAALLQAKGEVVSKWNGYLSQADTQYKTATQAQKDAQEKLEQVQRDQEAINSQIQQFGVSEATITELRANNAALQAAMAEVKKQGFNINVPELPKPAALDPMKSMEDRQKQGFQQMGAALRVQAKYQHVFGKPFGDDPIALIDEAIAARLPVEQYAEQKYKFTAESARIADETRKREIQAGIDAGVAKYKEDNPSTGRNPNMNPGLASRAPHVFQPRDAKDDKAFRNMPAKERIAQSRARTIAAINKGSAA